MPPSSKSALSRADWEGFAEQIAQSRDGQTLLFRVSRPLAEQVAKQDWDGPVYFRFFEMTDGTYELRMRRRDDKETP